MSFAVEFSQELLLSFEESVLSELRCSTCKELIHPPVLHCERGHSFCGQCYRIGDVCSFCGSNNNGTRTHHLERIFDHLTYPCKYFGKGCQKRCHPNKLKQHEEECQTFIIPCPLGLGTQCDFKGTRKQIVFHCQLAHSSFTFVGDQMFKQRILHGNFLNGISLPPYPPNFQNRYLYHFKDVLFQVLIQLHPDNVAVRICRLSPPSETEDSYDYFMKFYSFNDAVISRFHKRCCVSNGWQETFLAKANYVEINPQILRLCRYFTIEFREVC